MTTNELIKLVLEHDAKATPGPREARETGRETYVRQRAATDGAVIAYADAVGEPTVSEYRLIAAYRTAAPLLARKLQRAMESLEKLDLDAMVTLSHEVQEIAATAIAEIEAME